MAKQWKAKDLSALGATPCPKGMKRSEHIHNMLRDKLRAVKSTRQGKNILLTVEALNEAFSLNSEDSHEILHRLEQSHENLQRRLTTVRLQALGAAPCPRGVDKVDYAYTFLRSLLVNNTLANNLRERPYLITSRDLRNAFTISKETAHQVLRALENEQWAYAEGGAETRLLGPLRFNVRILMSNLLGSIGRALQVHAHGSTIPVPSKKIEVRKKVLEVEVSHIEDNPFSPLSCVSWLPHTGPRFRERTPVIVIRRAIYIRLYDVVPEHKEWDIPVGVHETVLDATIPVWSPKGNQRTTEKAAIEELTNFVSQLEPTDGLRARIREEYGLTPDKGIVQTETEHSSSRDKHLLEQVPGNEPLYLSLRQAVWTWRGCYHFKDQGHCWETTREMYLHTVGMHVDLMGDTPKTYLRPKTTSTKRTSSTPK